MTRSTLNSSVLVASHSSLLAQAKARVRTSYCAYTYKGFVSAFEEFGNDARCELAETHTAASTHTRRTAERGKRAVRSAGGRGERETASHQSRLISQPEQLLIAPAPRVTCTYATGTRERATQRARGSVDVLRGAERDCVSSAFHAQLRLRLAITISGGELLQPRRRPRPQDSAASTAATASQQRAASESPEIQEHGMKIVAMNAWILVMPFSHALCTLPAAVRCD